MKGTFSWKWAVLAMSVAALVAVGCAKKQTVKSEGAQGAPGAAAPGAVGEAPVKEAPPAPAVVAPATPPAAEAGVAVSVERLRQLDDVLFDFEKSEV
jgi:outer membrane protein OmpA-like peptidoglycan-associated protein